MGLPAIAPRECRHVSRPIALNACVRKRLLAALFLGNVLLVFGAGAPAHAASGSLAASKPFASHFLALQLSDASPSKQKEVLDVANNMLKFYGPDNIAIDVVTFGAGVSLLYADNKNAKMVNSLAAQGVRFDICENTLKTIKREKGAVPALNPHATKVPAGVARIMALVKEGYVLVRP